MIDAAKLLAAHTLASQPEAVADRMQTSQNEPPPRRFPLAGQGQLRPLADPGRQTPESNE
jgi:hypothetical protein